MNKISNRGKVIYHDTTITKDVHNINFIIIFEGSFNLLRENNKQNIVSNTIPTVLWSSLLVQINKENFSIKSVYLKTQSKLRAFATYPLT